MHSLCIYFRYIKIYSKYCIYFRNVLLFCQFQESVFNILQDLWVSCFCFFLQLVCPVGTIFFITFLALPTAANIQFCLIAVVFSSTICRLFARCLHWKVQSAAIFQIDFARQSAISVGELENSSLFLLSLSLSSSAAAAMTLPNWSNWETIAKVAWLEHFPLFTPQLGRKIMNEKSCEAHSCHKRITINTLLCGTLHVAWRILFWVSHSMRNPRRNVPRLSLALIMKLNTN